MLIRSLIGCTRGYRTSSRSSGISPQIHVRISTLSLLYLLSSHIIICLLISPAILLFHTIQIYRKRGDADRRFNLSSHCCYFLFYEERASFEIMCEVSVLIYWFLSLSTISTPSIYLFLFIYNRNITRNMNSNTVLKVYEAAHRVHSAGMFVTSLECVFRYPTRFLFCCVSFYWIIIERKKIII